MTTQTPGAAPTPKPATPLAHATSSAFDPTSVLNSIANILARVSVLENAVSPILSAAGVNTNKTYSTVEEVTGVAEAVAEIAAGIFGGPLAAAGVSAAETALAPAPVPAESIGTMTTQPAPSLAPPAPAPATPTLPPAPPGYTWETVNGNPTLVKAS